MSTDIPSATPEQLRATLEQHFKHVLSHDLQACQAIISVAAHREPDGSIHTCTMVGGDPIHIAILMARTIRELRQRDPLFAAAFLATILQPESAPSTTPEAAVDQLLTSLKNRPH